MNKKPKQQQRNKQTNKQTKNKATKTKNTKQTKQNTKIYKTEQKQKLKIYVKRSREIRITTSVRQLETHKIHIHGYPKQENLFSI